MNLPQLVRELEQTAVQEALIATSNNKTQAAKLLGVKRTTLVMMMKRLDLNELIRRPL